MGRNRFENLPAGLTAAQVVALLRICSTCGCVFYSGEVNMRGADEEPYLLSGAAIHDKACPANLGLGPRVPPAPPPS